jgi:hypothetical protein
MSRHEQGRMSGGRIARGRGRDLRLAGVVLGAAVLLEAIYVSRFSPFVTNDSAMHLNVSAALTDSLRGWDLGARFLEWNFWPSPNVLTDLVLAIGIEAVGPEWSERLVLLGYVIALPFATLYAVTSNRAASAWLALFALPLTFTLTFLYGFLNFSYSVVLFLVVAGFVLRIPAQMPRGRTAVLAALLLLAFFTHFVGFLAACLFVMLVLGARAAVQTAQRRTILVRGGAALIPGAALALVFVASSDSASVATWYRPTRGRLQELVTLTWGLVAYDDLEKLACVGLAVVLWGLIVLAAVRRRPWHERDPDTIGVALFAVLVALIELLAPEAVGSGGSFLTQRLALFPVYGALIWLARQDLRRSELMAGAVVAVAAAFSLAGVRNDELRQIERISADQAALTPCVQRDATIVQLDLARVPLGSAARIETLTNEAGRFAVARRGIDLANYQWTVPFSPQHFRPETDPYEYLAVGHAFHHVPPDVTFGRFERATGAGVDVVVLWARPAVTDAERTTKAFENFERSLRKRYHLYARSPLGWWEVWSKRPGTCARPRATASP